MIDKNRILARRMLEGIQDKKRIRPEIVDAQSLITSVTNSESIENIGNSKNIHYQKS